MTKFSFIRTKRYALLGRVIILMLACYGLFVGCVYPSVKMVLGRLSLRIPASNYFIVDLTNASSAPVMTSIHAVNAIGFWIFAGHERKVRERFGWFRNAEILLAPGENRTVRVPVETDPRMAMLLLVSRTELTERPKKQRLALHLQCWPWRDGTWSWPDGHIKVALEDADFSELDLDQLIQQKKDVLSSFNIRLVSGVDSSENGRSAPMEAVSMDGKNAVTPGK